MLPYLFGIVIVVIVVNIFLLMKRSKSSRNVGKAATAERVATVHKHDALVRALEWEQREAERRVKLQNDTFELYEQVRKQGEAADAQANEISAAQANETSATQTPGAADADKAAEESYIDPQQSQ